MGMIFTAGGGPDCAGACAGAGCAGLGAACVCLGAGAGLGAGLVAGAATCPPWLLGRSSLMLQAY